MKPSKKKLPLKKAAEESETHTNRPEKLSQEGAVLEKALLAAADALLEKAQQLDEWDQRWMVDSYVSCNITRHAVRGLSWTLFSLCFYKCKHSHNKSLDMCFLQMES